MPSEFVYPRRQLLKLGAIGGLAAATAGVLPVRAEARPPEIEVTELGPGVSPFSLASGVVVGDTMYVGTRTNIPIRVVGLHLPTGEIRSVSPIGGRLTTQALVGDKEGRYVYAAARWSGDANESNFSRIDLSDPDSPVVEPLAQITQWDPLAITISPDGLVVMTGATDAGKLHCYDPATGTLGDLGTPDPSAVWGRSIAATADTVFLGTRSSVPGSSATRADLFAVDRATGAARSILPPEFAPEPELRSMAVIDGLLVITTGRKIALLDLADLSSYRYFDAPRPAGRHPVGRDGKIWFGGLVIGELDVATGAFRDLLPDGITYGEIWGMGLRDGMVVGASGMGHVVEIDPVANTGRYFDLVAAGAPVEPQQPMSVRAAGRYAYVGGTNAIARHDLQTGEIVNVIFRGEAKDMRILDDVVYTCQYSDVGLLRYDPKTDGVDPKLVAPLPPGHNRPSVMHWDEPSGSLLIGGQSDTLGGGSLMTFDPASLEYSWVINPLGDTQWVRAVTTSGQQGDDIVYLGGQTADNSAGSIVAWNRRTSTEIWRVEPQARSTGVFGLAVLRRHLYAMCSRGDFLVLDRFTGRVIHRANHADLAIGMTTLETHRGKVYATSADAVFRFSPTRFTVEPIVSGLNVPWYGIPRSDRHPESGDFFTLKDRQLIRISIQG
ncbi:PQQ-binding-like beta-propeller repeat protein [Jiangella alba]|uniref:Outer membrane protein assembly factor BamB, contains PQQ-like beta-propeller repeat n=1 Tax=Jiangella alba TaxID=561176 RepID=A0A1H5JCI0_9ACTN|nr:PQQ-binding-like beta-propeller repeat protein [Jiangella alba]SEE50212.1 hypothetical protein SAMN04488561_1530 [Jiangella alba]